MNDRKFHVYCIYRPNGQPAYIGKGTGGRMARHFRKKTNPHLWAIIQKAKVWGQVCNRKILFSDLSEDQAYAKEVELIATYGREINGGILVNLTDGGDGTRGVHVTEEFRQKRSLYMTEFFADPANIKKAKERMIGNTHRNGKTMSDSARAAISTSLLGNDRTLGSKLTEEHKRKIGDAQRGKPANRSEAHKEALRKAHLGAKRSPETRAKIAAAAKARFARQRAEATV